MRRVERYQNADALWELERDWRELWHRCHSPVVFLHPLWAQAWWKHYGGGREVHLLGVRDERDNLLGLAPLCRKTDSGAPLEWLGGRDLSDSLDFLSWKGREMAVLNTLDRSLRLSGPKGAALDLSFVPEDSATLAEENTMLQAGWDVEVTREEVSPWVSLPGSWDLFLQNLTGKHRHELRRKMGKAQRVLNASFHVLEDMTGWAEAMEDFFRLHRMSQPEKAVFMDQTRKSFFEDVGQMFQGEGMLRLSWMEAAGNPIASAISFVHGGKWGLYNSGFDVEYRECSPGIVHVAYTIQRAIQEGLRAYDFLRGSEPYKYDFGARDRDLYHLRLILRAGGRI
jgi:CelD/BcsL family acetyltransferase involved in cellulose biosynthesis